jgi:hypothetical protein
VPHRALPLTLAVLILGACSDDKSPPAGETPDAADVSTVDAEPGGPDAAEGSGPDAGPGTDGPDAVIKVFDGTHVYFGEGGSREVDLAADLPAAGLRYRSIMMEMALRCPANGGCDWWDRHGHISVMRDGKEVEVLRFVTPYRKAMAVSLDVTDLRPLLTGRVTLRVFIDTWVGPGHPNGAGWLVDTTLRFTGGAPAKEVLAVIPLWQPGGVVFGDPARDPSRSATVAIPAGATGATLWTNITGHGQGNAYNCAEFCAANHVLAVGDRTISKEIWRDDCRTTAVPDQAGTWQYSRAGWCPGASVRPWIENIGAVEGGRDLTVRWTPEVYVNTCRPGAGSCSGCTLGTSCEYDGGNHTEPYYQLSGMLVVTR